MNKLKLGLAALIMSSCAVQKVNVKESKTTEIVNNTILELPYTFKDPFTYEEINSEFKVIIGIVTDKRCIDNKVGEVPVDKRIVDIAVYLSDDNKYIFQYDNARLFNQVGKGCLVDIVGYEKLELIFKDGKEVGKTIKELYPAGIILHKPDPSDSVYYNKYNKRSR